MDGSVKPFGKFTVIVKYEETNLFKQGNATAVTDSDSNFDTKVGKTFVEIFAEYQAYGIKYKEECPGNGSENVYYNGQLVKQFVDKKMVMVYSPIN